MARFIIPPHEGRVFKDQTWQEDYRSANGWRSIAEFSESPARYGELEAFAVELDTDSGSAERQLFDDIRELRPPFVAAEVVRVDGNLVAIGFYPAPE